MATIDNSESGFLGTGWSFPPAFNKVKRSVDMLSGEADIVSSLQILLSTSLGERIMRSKFGSRVPSMVFEPMDSSQRTMLVHHITESVVLNEPRIKKVDVKVEMNALEGRVEIQLDYTVAATNNRRNFVYPFYVIEGTEVTK